MAHSWYYRSREQVSGPLDFAELTQLAASGAIQPSEEVRSGDQGEWMPAGSIVGLFPEPEDLEDLSDLNFQFVESGAVRNGPSDSDSTGQLATPDDLDIQIVSEPAVPKSKDRPGNADPLPDLAIKKPASDGWFSQSLGQELGPMPLEELIRLVGDGVVLPNDGVRRGHTGAWQRAVRIDELASEFRRIESAQQSLVEEAAESIPSTARRESPARPQDGPAASDNGAPAVADDPELPPPPPLAETEPAERWFCRIDDVEHGPLTRDELSAMAQHDRIKPETQVKLGDDGSWKIAATVEGLFAPVETADPAGAAAAFASSSMSAYVAPKVKKEKKKKVKRSRGPREPLLPRIKEFAAKNKPIVFGGLGLAVVAAVVMFLAMGRSEAGDEYLTRMKAIFDEHKALKDRKAKQADWKPLIAKAEALQSEILPVLKKTAGSKRPELQELLWASQDMLPMLQKGASPRNEDEDRFVGHLMNAAKLLKKPIEIDSGAAPAKPGGS
jgi:GYF domain 2